MKPTREEVSALFVYKEDEAGGLMSPRFVRLRPESTVDEAISICKQAETVETIYYAYVLDHDQHLLGVIFCGNSSPRLRANRSAKSCIPT